MYFFTHINMAKLLYQHFIDEVELDRGAFYYGNIKPDLPSRARENHTMSHCLETVQAKARELMNRELSCSDYSKILGELCHYACDFCCYHHLNEELHDQNLEHFIYEIKLHIKLKMTRYKIIPSMKMPKREIKEILYEMRKAYYKTPKSMSRDIDYALKSSVWICESVIAYTNNNRKVNRSAEMP